jgi:hypothetical protein
VNVRFAVSECRVRYWPAVRVRNRTGELSFDSRSGRSRAALSDQGAIHTAGHERTVTRARPVSAQARSGP